VDCITSGRQAAQARCLMLEGNLFPIKSNITALILLTFILLGLPILSAFGGLGKREDLSQDLPDGVRAYRYHWDKETCVVYVAEMERSAADLHLEMALGSDRVLGLETVRRMAERVEKSGKQVWVATNAGFGVLFNLRGYVGVLNNLHVRDGELISQPSKGDACFGITSDGEFLAGSVKMKASLRILGQSISIPCINQRRGKDCSVVLYTPSFGNSTFTNSSGYELILTDLKMPITCKYRSSFTLQLGSQKGNSHVPLSGAVVSIQRGHYEDLFSKLKGGEQGELEIAFVPPDWGDVIQGVGGDARLIRKGKIDADLVRRHRSEKKHVPGKRGLSRTMSHEPRTALGFNSKKLFLMVVDGRQKGYSTGMTFYEVAEFMLELGAVEAINLDGGASSTFIIDGEVVNRPSGKKERKVLDAMLITTGTAITGSRFSADFSQAPPDSIKVLALSGNSFDVEYPVLRKFRKVDDQKLYYQETRDARLPGLEKAHVLWISQGEISEGNYKLSGHTETQIKTFVQNGGVVIVMCQDSDNGRPCPIGWFPDSLKGVERGTRSDFQATRDAKMLFTTPNVVRSGRVVMDDSWMQWSDKMIVLATTNDSKDLAVGMLRYGKGMYLITSLQNEPSENIAANRAIMENLVHFAVKWLIDQKPGLMQKTQ